MGDRVTIVYEFASVQDKLKELRKKLQHQLRDKDPELVDATVMSAAELVENAIKYGSSEISFNLAIENDLLTIGVANRSMDQGDLDSFKAHVAKIRQSEDVGELYTQRLMELIEDPLRGPTQLGLIRIAHEGKFELDYRQEDDLIRVTATRSLN